MLFIKNIVIIKQTLSQKEAISAWKKVKKNICTKMCRELVKIHHETCTMIIVEIYKQSLLD